MEQEYSKNSADYQTAQHSTVLKDLQPKAFAEPFRCNGVKSLHRNEIAQAL